MSSNTSHTITAALHPRLCCKWTTSLILLLKPIIHVSERPVYKLIISASCGTQTHFSQGTARLLSRWLRLDFPVWDMLTAKEPRTSASEHWMRLTHISNILDEASLKAEGCSVQERCRFRDKNSEIWPLDNEQLWHGGKWNFWGGNQVNCQGSSENKLLGQLTPQHAALANKITQTCCCLIHTSYKSDN